MEEHGRQPLDHMPRLCWEPTEGHRCIRVRGHEGSHDHLVYGQRVRQQRDALQRALTWALLTLRGKWRDIDETMQLTLNRACDTLRASFQPKGEGDDLSFSLLWRSSEDGVIDLTQSPALALQQIHDLKDHLHAAKITGAVLVTALRNLRNIAGSSVELEDWPELQAALVLADAALGPDPTPAAATEPV